MWLVFLVLSEAPLTSRTKFSFSLVLSSASPTSLMGSSQCLCSSWEGLGTIVFLCLLLGWAHSLGLCHSSSFQSGILTDVHGPFTWHFGGYLWSFWNIKHPLSSDFLNYTLLRLGVFIFFHDFNRTHMTLHLNIRLQYLISTPTFPTGHLLWLSQKASLPSPRPHGGLGPHYLWIWTCVIDL